MEMMVACSLLVVFGRVPLGWVVVVTVSGVVLVVVVEQHGRLVSVNSLPNSSNTAPHCNTVKDYRKPLLLVQNLITVEMSFQ